MPNHVLRDDQHILTLSCAPGRYDVTTLAGEPVGAVYFSLRGWRCWRDGQPTLVSNLHRALAHYRS